MYTRSTRHLGPAQLNLYELATSNRNAACSQHAATNVVTILNAFISGYLFEPSEAEEERNIRTYVRWYNMPKVNPGILRNGFSKQVNLEIAGLILRSRTFLWYSWAHQSQHWFDPTGSARSDQLSDTFHRRLPL
jgi:hypothetical protein